MKFSNNVIKNVSLLTLVISIFYGCNENDSKVENIHDTTKPVVITDFEPSEGGAKTKLFIHGSNFGTDASKIKVNIGGVKAGVVNSTGDIIYCIVPQKATEGSVEVIVGDADPVKAVDKFKYVPNTQVTTLVGKVDETGKVEVLDGTFEEAGLSGPNLLAVDPKNTHHIYFIDGDRSNGASIRFIDLKERIVRTLLQKGQGNWENIRGLLFTASGDSLLVVNQKDATDAIAVSYMTRENGFKKPQPMIYGRKCFSAAAHPNGEIYYTNRITGALIRFDTQTKEEKEMFRLTNGSGEAAFFVFMHPEGSYAYINNASGKTILKAEYDWEKKELKNPNIFCGKQSVEGWQDGQGVNAILGNPFQGCFVKNDKYVEEGRADCYDYYFCDQFAHCIRYVTPDGFVHTYAGRGSAGTNTNPFGYVDGDLKKEARFRFPSGISFDPENEIFYIGDADNHVMRNIVVDE